MFRSTRLIAALAVTGVLYGADCSFRVNPEKFLNAEGDIRRGIDNIARRLTATARTVAPGEIPRNNFIDDAIFGKLEQLDVPSAPLAGDEEFLRRISYDLTGHPPSPTEVREFLADANPNKRNDAIDRLLYSPKATDRWVMWLGDLLQNTAFPQNFDRQYYGRNGYYEWMWLAMAGGKSLRQIALDAIAGTGNNYDMGTGGTNFILNGITAMGPIQDTYDNAMRVSVTSFLGLSNYDCLLCHDGRRRLDQVNLWGSQVTRIEAMRMSAFFSRLSMAKPRLAASEYYYNSYNVTDAIGGAYFLTTNFGNRPDRTPLDGKNFLEPEYRDGRTPPDGNYRKAFAEFLVDDPMFAINFANRIWRELFTMGLVEPVDALDPARLDPSKPPPAPWTLQASHPELLKQLADELISRDYNLREFVRFIVQSSAYQISSRYDGKWKIDYVPLFARHYPRRLEGEEVHDTVVLATNVQTIYTQRGLNDTPWAMKMSEPVEPRSNGAALNFMLPFYRGNRDSFFRIPDGSIQQQLNLMNDPFVLNKLRVTASPTLRAVAAMESNDEAVEQLFLLFLARRPDAREKAVAVKYLSQAGNQRNAYVEDLAWSLVNKTDFLFNY